MSVLAIEELSIYYDTFRNIDLHLQGVYCIRTSLMQATTGIQGYPYNFLVLNSSLKEKAHSLSEACIIECSMYSKHFLIKYFDEVIEIKEKVFFRCEVPFNPENQFSLKIELLLNEAHENTEFEDLQQDSSKFTVMSTVTATLDFTLSMESGFLPITFPRHYSILNSTIHYLLLDFKFPAPEALALSLFSHKGQPRKYIGGSETDRVYKQFALPLISSYVRLRKHFLLLLHQCLSAEDRISFGLEKTPPDLALPGEIARVPYSMQGKTNLKDLFLDFSSRVGCHDPLGVTISILSELGSLSKQLKSLWIACSEGIAKFPTQVRILLQGKYRDDLRIKYSAGYISGTVTAKQLHLARPNSHKGLARSVRLQNSFTSQNSAPITDPLHVLNPAKQPIIIEEMTVLQPARGLPSPQPKALQLTHLLVLVHGFQGSPSDMKTLKNNIIAVNPHSHVLLSLANSEDTECSLQSQGLRLANEVKSYINAAFLHPGPSSLFPHPGPNKLSFLGHSLGGLTIRAALPHLSQFAPKMHLFMTTSTPHLGVTSKLLTTGIWLLNKLQRVPSLVELQMKDNAPEQCTLYQLSQAEGLAWFKHVVLLSSPQDKYVTAHSARIESSQADDFPAQMARNLLCARDSVNRLSVDFKISRSFMGSLTGRAAHVQFLENETLMKSLLYNHPEYFS